MNYALKYELIRKVMNTQIYRCNIYSYDLKMLKYWWPNTNKLLGGDFFPYGKTGTTDTAGPCLVAQFKIAGYEARGCLIDSKTAELRWKEMAIILLWQFDKYLRKHKVGWYNYQTFNEFKKSREEELQAKRLEKEDLEK